jgi:trehalose 6-phosphate synthase
VLNNTGGLWFGWSGKVVDSSEDDDVNIVQAGPVKLVTVDLTQVDHDAFYLGYSNGVLWPVFHYRLDLADFDAGYITGYRRVNQQFARKLLPFLRPDDVIWVHDYHLIPLAAELRALGCRQRIGFFLHIPLPPPLLLAAIPGHDWLIRALFAYDLVGFQSHADLNHFAGYVEAEAHAQPAGDGRWRAFGRTVHAGAYPIGIDVGEFTDLTNAREAMDMYERMKNEYSRRKLLVGVDRLDYSKGLPQRMRAFRELLARHPETRKSATLIQIASPSREDVGAYTDILHELEALCGSINGNYGELDGMPVRYMHRTVARARLPGLYRAARVALVTPLRDGMNLVAKEFLCAQDPEDPGVLVLSRFAGAAEQLKEALLVNPYDTEGTAAAILLALQMPLEERRRRYFAMMDTIRRQDVHWWCDTFLAELGETSAEEKGPSWLRL